MRTGPANGVNDIFYARAANQNCRTFIDSLVPELARLVIGIVLRENEIAGETRGEISEINAKACIWSCHVLPFFLLFVWSARFDSRIEKMSLSLRFPMLRAPADLEVEQGGINVLSLVTIIRSGEDWLLTKLALFSPNFRHSSTGRKHQIRFGPGIVQS
jgi:hypothetical protein